MNEPTETYKRSKEPLVSVGLPTYGRPQCLRKVLDQLLNQTYHNIEILVSDNCHPDLESYLIAKQYSLNDSRVTAIRQESNIGLVPNHNYVRQEAKGEFFMWLGDDDEISPTYIEECMKLIRDDESVSLVGGVGHRYLEGKWWYDYQVYDSSGKTTKERLDELSNYAFGEYWLFEHYFYGIFRRDRVPDGLWTYVKSVLLHFIILAESGQIRHCPRAEMIKNTTHREIENHAIYAGHTKIEWLSFLRGKDHSNLQYTLPIFLKMSQVVVTSKRLKFSEKVSLLISFTARLIKGPVVAEIKLYLPRFKKTFAFYKRVAGGIKRRLGLID